MQAVLNTTQTSQTHGIGVKQWKHSEEQPLRQAVDADSQPGGGSELRQTPLTPQNIHFNGKNTVCSVINAVFCGTGGCLGVQAPRGGSVPQMDEGGCQTATRTGEKLSKRICLGCKYLKRHLRDDDKSKHGVNK